MKKLFYVILLLNYNLTFSQDINFVFYKMLEEIDKINSISFIINVKERFYDKIKTSKGFFKINYNPFRLYYKQLDPPTYAEVLINDKYKTHALVNPNSFPFINLKLSVYGSKLRESQHHNLYQVGYKYFADIIRHLIKKYNVTDLSKIGNIITDFNYNNTSYYKITLINKNYSIINYKVEENITPQFLALKLNLCDISILELNRYMTDIFYEIKKGTVIKIPSDYAKKIEILIDKKLFIPVLISVYDNNGLFEEYYFEKIKINCNFTQKDFDENNEEYGF
ncbi:MAG: DUF1571 domain-containing protein [Bacteroidales bacterium]|nr:DUF1571 domain-containing protein [Bacteroidales bacterium]